MPQSEDSTDRTESWEKVTVRMPESMVERLDELAAQVRAIQPDDTTAQRIANGQKTLDGDEADA